MSQFSTLSIMAGQSAASASMGFGAAAAAPASFASTLGPIGAGVGAGLALIGAVGTNQALRRTANNAANAAGIDYQNIVDASTVERLQATKRFRAIAGGTLASAAERGLPSSGSIDDLLITNAVNASTDQQIININERTRLRTRRAQFDQQIAQLRSQQRFGPLDAIMGGLQGFQAGSALGTGIDQLSQ